MGEIADMMLDGTLCSACGDFLDTGAGYAVMCPSCRDADRYEPRVPRFSRHKVKPSPIRADQVACPTCGKRVKKVGLRHHVLDVHPELGG